MLKTGILNPELNHLLARIRHTAIYRPRQVAQAA